VIKVGEKFKDLKYIISYRFHGFFQIIMVGVLNLEGLLFLLATNLQILINFAEFPNSI